MAVEGGRYCDMSENEGVAVLYACMCSDRGGIGEDYWTDIKPPKLSSGWCITVRMGFVCALAV